jgi:hypothetical protein
MDNSNYNSNKPCSSARSDNRATPKDSIALLTRVHLSYAEYPEDCQRNSKFDFGTFHELFKHFMTLFNTISALAQVSQTKSLGV